MIALERVPFSVALSFSISILILLLQKNMVLDRKSDNYAQKLNVIVVKDLSKEKYMIV